MKGFIADIEELPEENGDYRRCSTPVSNFS